MLRANVLTAGAVLAIVSLLTLAPSPAGAQYTEEDLFALEAEIDALAAKFPCFKYFPYAEKDDETAFLYADTKGIIHHYVSDAGRLREKWKSFPVDGSVREIFGEDLDGNGLPEIVAATSTGRIYVWETKEYELLWESVEENFEAIQAMTIADVDPDQPLELIVCADNKIYYIDGVEFFREKEGRDFYDPTAMLVADVDGDLNDELITNDGYVVDTTSLNIEWATEGFGYPMSLFDLDNDGVLELVGDVGGALRFWDIEDRREIW